MSIGYVGGQFGGHIGFSGGPQSWECIILYYFVYLSWKNMHKQHKCNFVFVKMDRITVFIYNSVRPHNHIAAILAAILDSYIVYMIFDSFIGSGMVENIYLDTKIMTLSSLLRKLEVFLHIFGMLGGHFGGHLVFIDNGYVLHDF